MNRNEYTPDNFPERFEADGITVEYADLKEIQMGSPVIGRLSINGVPLSGHFGGPPLLSRSEVYAPRFLARERKVSGRPTVMYVSIYKLGEETIRVEEWEYGDILVRGRKRLIEEIKTKMTEHHESGGE